MLALKVSATQIMFSGSSLLSTCAAREDALPEQSQEPPSELMHTPKYLE